MIKKKSKHFIEFVENLIKSDQISYTDAIIHYCEVNGVEPASVARLIPKDMKSKIEVEAKKLNYLK